MSHEGEEAERIMQLCSGDGLRALEMVQGQLGVLVLRTQQVMLSPSEIVITVTGLYSMTVPPAVFELASDLWRPEPDEWSGAELHFL